MVLWLPKRPQLIFYRESPGNTTPGHGAFWLALGSKRLTEALRLYLSELISGINLADLSSIDAEKAQSQIRNRLNNGSDLNERNQKYRIRVEYQYSEKTGSSVHG
jgi:hypothetical protein